MESTSAFQRYQLLQSYVGWTEADAQRVASVASLLEPALPGLVDDFYRQIERHESTRKIITGGTEQIARLKKTLIGWLRGLLAGRYDAEYVAGRWRVGWRHVEIGLDQVFTNVALSRLRQGLLAELQASWHGDAELLRRTLGSLNTLLDLDLAIIEDAYQSEYLARQQRSERLAAIGQVAGGVAHELRNPLNVVKTSVYYLLNARQLLPEKRLEHLQRIERHVELADNVITALSNFARQPLPTRHPFSLMHCIQEALETNPIPEKVRVMVDSPEQLPAALADHDQIRIVFANLIRNACDAMQPSGGRLGIAIRVADGKLIVDVSDTGVGIEPDRLSQIMEPLYSTKARGLGLGLAIARAILDRNQGSLSVVSTPGEGSIFTVTLPAQTDSPSP